MADVSSSHKQIDPNAVPLITPPTAGSGPAPFRQTFDEANGSTQFDAAHSGGAESQPHFQQRTQKRRQQPGESRSSKYRGVQWDRNGSRWRARLHTDRTRHIGYFASEEDAAMAWDLAVLRYYGEDEGRKKLNFGEKSIEKYREQPGAAPRIMRMGNSEELNSSGYFRGVNKQDNGTFEAYVLNNRCNFSLGLYKTAEEAARAHDRAAIEINGWGALTNFPLSDYYELKEKMMQNRNANDNEKGGAIMMSAAPMNNNSSSNNNNNNNNNNRSSNNGDVSTLIRHHSSGSLLPSALASLRSQHMLPPRAPPLGPSMAGALAASALPSSVMLHHHHRQQQQQQHFHNVNTPHIIRTSSQLSLDGSTGLVLPASAHAASLPAMAGLHATPHGWLLTPPSAQFPPLSTQQQIPGIAGYAAAAAGGHHLPGGGASTASMFFAGSHTPAPDTAIQIERKRMRSDVEPSPSTGTGTSGGTAGVASAGSDVFSGVRKVGDGWHAVLSVDLGQFNSFEEATRAHDRASLIALGFTAPTHAALHDALLRSALVSGPPQLLPATPFSQQHRFRGICLRGSSYLAQLDIAGKAYELGPFGSEVDAAKAYDRYSLLLQGVRASTNFPPWEHLASAQEISSLVNAVFAVSSLHGGTTKSGQPVTGTSSGAGTAAVPGVDSSAMAAAAAAVNALHQHQAMLAMASGSGIPSFGQTNTNNNSNSSNSNPGSMPPVVVHAGTSAGGASSLNDVSVDGMGAQQQQQRSEASLQHHHMTEGNISLQLPNAVLQQQQQQHQHQATMMVLTPISTADGTTHEVPLSTAGMLPGTSTALITQQQPSYASAQLMTLDTSQPVMPLQNQTMLSHGFPSSSNLAIPSVATLPAPALPSLPPVATIAQSHVAMPLPTTAALPATTTMTVISGDNGMQADTTPVSAMATAAAAAAAAAVAAAAVATETTKSNMTADATEVAGAALAAANELVSSLPGATGAITTTEPVSAVLPAAPSHMTTAAVAAATTTVSLVDNQGQGEVVSAAIPGQSLGE